MLPTASKMTRLIREADTLADLKEIISPDPATRKVAIVLDGTHVRVDWSGDKDRRVPTKERIVVLYTENHKRIVS